MTTLESWFQLSRRGSSVSRELRGAVATFLTMAYILLVNPTILASAGVPKESAVACTALAAAVSCIAMGLYANFPLALASGMGLNALVATLVITQKVPDWRVAMGLIVLDGLLVLLLVLVGLREAVMSAIPKDLRLAIGGGIGLFIAFIGLANAGIVRKGGPFEPAMMPGDLLKPEAKIAIAVFLVTAGLMAWRLRGALLIGIALGTVIALKYGITSLPSGLAAPSFESAFKADVIGALKWHYVPLLLAIVMVDFFDTLGTVTAVAEEAELIGPDGKVEGLRRVLVVDSAAASVGGLLGASSVTSYIESAAGIAEGARTGLHTVFVGLFFLLSIVAAPYAGIVPACATAPALVLVGFYMIAHVGNVDFTKPETGIPAFVTLLTIPLTYSISHGIGFGFISYVAVKMIRLQFRDVHPVMYAATAAFAAYFVWGG